jgi:hypothetical protein
MVVWCRLKEGLEGTPALCWVLVSRDDSTAESCMFYALGAQSGPLKARIAGRKCTSVFAECLPDIYTHSDAHFPHHVRLGE